MTTNDEAMAAVLAWCEERFDALPDKVRVAFIAAQAKGKAEMNVEIRVIPPIRTVVYLDYFDGAARSRTEIGRFETDGTSQPPVKKSRFFRRHRHA